jgi:hypothetical protein
MHWLWQSLEIIVPACVCGMLLSGLGIAVCYAMVFLCGKSGSEVPGSVALIAQWSVTLAWFSFAFFWFALVAGFIMFVTRMMFYPDSD